MAVVMRRWVWTAGAAAALAIVAVPLLTLREGNMALGRIRAAQAAANFEGRRAVVLGGTSGIGEGIAKRLAQASFSVTIVGRSAERGAEIVRELNTLGGSGHDFVACDAFRLRNVARCGTEIAAREAPIDVLVMSQGMATTEHHLTDEGLDQKLVLHYFSRMAFLITVLPSLRRAPSPRVLSVLSAGVHSPYAGWDTDFELRDSYSLKNAADAAGFYNDLGLDAVRRLPGNERIVFAHAAPGFVATRWGTELPWFLRMLVRGIQVFGKSPADCAEFMCAPLLRSDADTRSLAEPGTVMPLVLLTEHAEPARPTSAHTDVAREGVWTRTLEVLRRVGIPTDTAERA